MNPEVSTAIILDTRTVKSNGKFPVKLRVSFRRQSKYYRTGKDLSKEEFDQVMSVKTRKEFKTDRDYLDAFKSKANEVKDSLVDFSFKSFDKKLTRNSRDLTSVYEAYDDYIQTLKDEGRISTASSYECSKKSLMSFKESLRYEEVDIDFLSDYERWMIKSGNSNTTIGFYLRTLRCLINIAIEEGLMARERYPFGKRKYKIPTGRNIKKALPIDVIGLLQNYKTHNPAEQRAKDFWLFSYYGNGCNFKDIALMKYGNLEGDYIVFNRAKTQNALKSDPKPISIYVNEFMRSIINKYGNQDKSKNNNIFPIITPDSTPEEIRARTQNFIQITNKNMRRISKHLGITSSITTYFARHSFSTILLRSKKVTLDYISERMGHANSKTTLEYFAGFEQESLKEVSEILNPNSTENLKAEKT